MNFQNRILSNPSHWIKKIETIWKFIDFDANWSYVVLTSDTHRFVGSRRVILFTDTGDLSSAECVLDAIAIPHAFLSVLRCPVLLRDFWKETITFDYAFTFDSRRALLYQRIANRRNFAIIHLRSQAKTDPKDANRATIAKIWPPILVKQRNRERRGFNYDASLERYHG